MSAPIRIGSFGGPEQGFVCALEMTAADTAVFISDVEEYGISIHDGVITIYGHHGISTLRWILERAEPYIEAAAAADYATQNLETVVAELQGGEEILF